MNIKVPYSKLELLLAAIHAGDKLGRLGKESEDIIKDKLTRLSPDDNKSKNAEIAEFHGISVQDLINSPNMVYMSSQYDHHLVNQSIEILKSFDFSDKESWAILLCDKLEDL